jgi:hypothetical protein
MINLVPGVVRKAIVKEYWIRVISVFLFLTVLASLLSVLFALPVYVLIKAQVDAYGASATEAAARVAEFDISTGALTKANSQAEKIVSQKSDVDFTEVMNQIEELANTGISLKSYQFARKEGEMVPVLLAGRASSRQSLADFHFTLKSNEMVEKVDLPISNLAKEKDIDFTMTITLKKTK